MVKLLNLLPDSKQKRQAAGRARKLSITIAAVIMAVAIGIPLVLLAIKGSQLLLLNRTQDKIDAHKATLKDTPNISTMLTVKDHLASLPALYEQRLIISELMAYLPAILPAEIRLTGLELDSSGSITLSGVAPSYTVVDKFYRGVLYAGITPNPNRVDPDPQSSGNFTGVLLEDVSGPSGSEVIFTIRASFSSSLIDGVPGG